MKKKGCNIPYVTKIIGCILISIVVLYFYGKLLGYTDVKKFTKDQGSLVAGILALFAALITIESQFSLRKKNRFDDKREILANRMMKIDRSISNIARVYNSFLKFRDNELEPVLTKLDTDFNEVLYEIKLISESIFSDLIEEMRDYTVLLDILKETQNMLFYSHADIKEFNDFLLSRELDRQYPCLLTIRNNLSNSADISPLTLSDRGLGEADRFDSVQKSMIFNKIAPVISTLQKEILNKLLKL